MNFTATAVCSIAYLAIAVVDDLWFKKFHNWIFLSLTLIGFLIVTLTGNPSLFEALGGFVVGGLLMLPLVLMGAIGAGDMKFMMCFGILMGPIKVFEIFLYALFWGAAIGVLQAILAGRFSKMLGNLKLMSVRVKPHQPNKIPYTVAILFAWLSYSFYGGIL